MKAIDSHCHLYFSQFDEDREKVIQKSKKELDFVVVPGTDLENNKKSLKLEKKHPEFIKANLGVHPTYTDSFDELKEIKRQIRENDPKAVGEIGLDHHHVTEKEMREKQKKVFKEMLELAEELDKPVVVHSREAEQRCIDILDSYSLQDVFLHCFNGKPSLAEKAVNKGMKIGITTQVLYSNRVQEIAELLDIENILLETDSPFLYRGERNEPLNVLESVEKIAEIKKLEKKNVIARTTHNARKVFQ